MYDYRHTAETFLLSYNGTSPYTDSQCVSYGTLDYLFIPEGLTSTGIYADKYCDSALNSTFYVTCMHISVLFCETIKLNINLHIFMQVIKRKLKLPTSKENCSLSFKTHLLI